MSSTRQALEDFLAANPDDLAAHSAYADWLTENNDPRGEYIRLLLALEDTQLTQKQRHAFAATAAKLGKKHEAEWIGSFKKFVNVEWYPIRRSSAQPVNGIASIYLQRGWIHRLEICTPVEEVWESVLTCPIARQVQVLEIRICGDLFVTNSTDVLKYTTKFQALRQLIVRWEQFADDSVEYLLQTGLVSQLTSLDLSHCEITDDGAVALANHPAVIRLEHLLLEGNYISPIGAEALRAIGFKVDPQLLDTPRGLARHED